MKSKRWRWHPFAFLLSFSAVIASSWAQSAAILRPSIISKESHELVIDPSLAGFRIGDRFEIALKKIGKPLEKEILGDAPDAPVSPTNKSTGISIVAARTQGVGIILVTDRNAGVLDGVRVGDSYARIVAK